MRRILGVAIIVGAGLGGSACGQDTQRVVSAQQGVSQPASRLAATAKWRMRGAELIQEKLALVKTGAPAALNSVNFAYPSLPIDIAGPGKYSIHFGPIDEAFRLGDQPTGWSTYWPPDTSFRIRPVGGEEIVSLDGRQYLKTDYLVMDSEFQSGYAGFYGWVA